MIKDILKKYNIRPSKRLGQNFLIDESVLEKIITAAKLSKNDTILEIGPGLGILTMKLAKKTKRVVAVEKDEKMCEALQDLLSVENVRNVEIINGDILKIQSASWRTKFSILDSYKVVANLPYYIVSPVIRVFLDPPAGGLPAGGKPELMVLMIQKEVAQRICAKPPDMSILAVAVQFYGQPEIVSEVSKTSFYPQPKVDSAILRINPRIDTNKITNIHELDTREFFGLVRAGFAHKRKLLISNVSGKINPPAGGQKSKIKIIFNDVGIAPTARAENLSVENWISLYGKIKNIL